VLLDDWRFAELAWLHACAHNAEAIDHAPAFAEMKARHAELFADLLPHDRGRPETYPTRQELAVLASHLRWAYEVKRREHKILRARDHRLRGDLTPSDEAFKWVATHYNIERGKLRRALFTKATNAAFRALLKEHPGYAESLAAVSALLCRPRP
jgi:hypothetical protein